MDTQTVIVHGVERKGCVADKAGLRTDAMETLVDQIDMSAQRDQTLVRLLADYLTDLLLHSLFAQKFNFKFFQFNLFLKSFTYIHQPKGVPATDENHAVHQATNVRRMMEIVTLMRTA